MKLEPYHPLAWIEVDLDRLHRNFQLINADKPPSLKILAVVKDEAYGHGAEAVSRVALAEGVAFLAVGSLEEGLALRENGIQGRVLVFYERQEAELPWCIQHELTVCVSDEYMAAKLAQAATAAGRQVPVHLKLNTGMNRYGVAWDQALPLVEFITRQPSLRLEGMMSHFAMSDETDKTYARLQLQRFCEVVSAVRSKGLAVPFCHICNSGGFLDLPDAHFDMVRMGILPLGIFPSQVCRRIPGLEQVMSVKARIASVKDLRAGEKVGYGMRYEAPSPRRIAAVPVGYGDGYPRMRNQGCVLIHGQRAPIIGTIAMDVLMADVTDIPATQRWDEAVLMGRQGQEEISVHEVAKWKSSVSYDILVSWKSRLPRINVSGGLEQP